MVNIGVFCPFMKKSPENFKIFIFCTRTEYRLYSCTHYEYKPNEYRIVPLFERHYRPNLRPQTKSDRCLADKNIYLSDRPQRLFQIVQSKPKKIVANVMYKYNMYLRRGEEGGGTTGRRLGPSEQPLHVRERTHIDTGMHVISASGCLMSQQSRLFCKL